MSSSQASPAQSSAPSASNKPQRILACTLCQHRKIKCDRQFPCSNCTKANQKCQPSTPAPARKRRRPNADLIERLARCEELIRQRELAERKEDAVEKAESPTSTPSLATRSSTARVGSLEDQIEWATPDGSVRHGSGSRASSSSAHTRKLYHELSHHGRLVKEDGGTRFMDSIILGTIYDELRAMREIVNADENDENTPDTATPDDNSELVLGADTPSSISPEDLWPDAGHVFRLWQIYLDRVNPLTKIIHVPTLQPYVAEATTGCSNLPKNIEALLFSIWLMAAVAMSPDECQALLGYSRDVALQRFSGGVRMALIRLNFLKSHDMTALQALVIYLISLQGRYNRHAAWILNGVVIRIAQKMGLHRDGEMLGLGPFECEMRRRLWWQIIMLDAKYAMMTGLNHSLLPRIWDTKEPKNLNDVDMFPSATEPFQDRDGPTEMIFVMITNKVARFLVETPGLEIMLMLAEWSGAPSTANPQLIEFRTVIARLGQEMLDMLNKYCDPTAGPVHEMAVEVKAQIIKKLSALATSAKEQPEWGSEIMDQNDNAFKLAICAMEHEQENCYASQDKGFLWHALLHFQLDVFIYLAGQLCNRLEGALVDRAWKQVEVIYHFHPELYDTSNNKTYFMLARFILRAWSKREEIICRKTGHMPTTPPCIEKLRSIMPPEDIKSEPSSVRMGNMSRPQLEGPDPSFDQFLGGFLDVSSSDWDMFAGLPVNNMNEMPPSYYGMNPSGW